MITLRQEESSLYITITGQLRISNMYELTCALTRFSDMCNKYYLDLQKVVLISDGGLAVLLMFTSHARRHGQNVHLLGCSSAVTQRIAQFPSLQALCQDPYEPAPQHQESDQPKRHSTNSTHYRSKHGLHSPNIFMQHMA